MKKVLPIAIALVLAVSLALIAYRVSVHFATAPPPAPPPVAIEAPDAPATLPPAQAEARDAIERARPVQAAVDAYYETHGGWPSNLAQLGLGNPDQHAGGPVAAISVHPYGVVAIALKPHVARGGVVRLTPRIRADGHLEWTCRASNYPAATRLPDCRN